VQGYEAKGRAHGTRSTHLVENLEPLSVSGVVYEPAQAIPLLGQALSLDDESAGVGVALRRVRHSGRQAEHLPLLDAHVARSVMLNDLEVQRAFQLEEELLALVDVVIRPLVGPPDEHDLEMLLSAEDQVVAHGRL